MSAASARARRDAATGRPAAELGLALTRRRARVGELLFKLALQACLFVALAFLVWLLAYVLYKGWNRLDSRLWENMPWAEPPGFPKPAYSRRSPARCG